MADPALIKSNLLSGFRDFTIDGVPAPGPNEPLKSEIRQPMGQLVDYVASVAASVGNGVSGYALIADLPTLAPADAGSLAKVEEHGQVYRWTGTAWTVFADPTIAAAALADDAAEVATQKAAEAEDAVAVAVTPLLGATFGGLEDWGAAGLTPGITSVPANRLMISDAPAGRQGTMEMSVTLAKPGRIVIFILNRVDGDSWTLAFARANDLPAGRSDLKDWLPEVGAAQHVAVLATAVGVLTYSFGGSETIQLCDGVPGGSFDSTATLTSVTPCWSWTVREAASRACPGWSDMRRMSCSGPKPRMAPGRRPGLVRC